MEASVMALHARGVGNSFLLLGRSRVHSLFHGTSDWTDATFSPASPDGAFNNSGTWSLVPVPAGSVPIPISMDSE
jgi:hypothetical protein